MIKKATHKLPCCHLRVTEVDHRTRFEINQHYVIIYLLISLTFFDGCVLHFTLSDNSDSVGSWVLSSPLISALINTDCWTRLAMLPLRFFYLINFTANLKYKN